MLYKFYFSDFAVHYNLLFTELTYIFIMYLKKDLTIESHIILCLKIMLTVLHAR